MDLKQKLPVTYLLFTSRGRLSRSTFWTALIFSLSAFYVLSNLFLWLGASFLAYLLYPALFWVLVCILTKRLHDSGRSGKQVLWLLLPVFGPLYVFYLSGFRRGELLKNRFGSVPGSKADYAKNDDGEELTEYPKTSGRIINDVTKLNPILVKEVIRPESIEELCAAIKNTENAVSLGGGRFSMGGQTASTQSVHIDLRKLNRVIEFKPENKFIKVEAGIRWCDIQQLIDPHHLSVKIMQTYANFTVGGASSVNAHGRYMGQGPAVLSVREIQVVLADGSLLEASKEQNQEIFYAAIGGYGAIGIIATATLNLAENVPVKRIHQKLSRTDYGTYFQNHVRNNRTAVFHNGDIYPPDYKRMRAVSWVETDEKPTVKTRLMPLKDSYPIERYFLWAFTSTPWGKWRREFLIDPILYLQKKIHWRNYEAGYDVAELEPKSRKDSTYVLLEYFVPIASFQQFADRMAEIFTRFNVNVLNVSVRHALADPGTYLAWAREEVFAFVVYYKQDTSAVDKNKVAVWTRELADAVIAVNGAYYLPYQIHPTIEQFHKAYPNAHKLFKLKRKLDPGYKFRNSLWDSYYTPSLSENYEY